MNKQILTLVFLCTLLNSSFAQKEYLLDTLLGRELVFEDNKLFYKYKTKNNEIITVEEKLNLVKFDLDKSIRQLKNVRGVQSSNSINNSVRSILLNGKLHTSTFELISDSIYQDVHGRIADNYILKKDKNLILLDTEYNKEVVLGEFYSYRVWSGNDNFFLLDDFSKGKVYIFNDKGIKTAEIENSKVYNYPRNNFFAQIYKTDVKFEGGSNIYRINGELVMKGYCYESSPDVVVLSETFGAENFDLYYKGEKQEINDQWEDLDPLSPPSTYYYDKSIILLELKNGLAGVIDNDLNVIIKPVFEEIKMIKGDIIYAKGIDDQLYVFDTKGKHLNKNIELTYSDIDINTHFLFNQLNKIKLFGTTFYVYVDLDYGYKLIDENWNNIGEGQLFKLNENYCLNSGLDCKNYRLPKSAIEHIVDEEVNLPFNIISKVSLDNEGDKVYYNNICDQSGEILFEDFKNTTMKFVSDKIIEVIKLGKREASKRWKGPKPIETIYIRILEK